MNHQLGDIWFLIAYICNINFDYPLPYIVFPLVAGTRYLHVTPTNIRLRAPQFYLGTGYIYEFL